MIRRAAVITVSDRSSRGERDDLSGPALAERLTAEGYDVASVTVVPDDRAAIAAELRRVADDARVTLVLTTGGTGFAPRDVTPEATRDVIEKEAPGLAEHARAATLPKTKFAVLSRGVAGIRGRSLILNLPGSPRGAVEVLEALAPVIPHALSVLTEAADEHPAP